MRKTAPTAAVGLLALALTAQAQDNVPAATLAASAPSAPAVTTRCIDIEVHNVRPQQGLLMLAAYSDALSYDKQPMAAVRAPAGAAITQLQMCGISGDTLAVTMFQDLDSDGKMGRNILGMPTEPWGSSGKPGPLGPNWDASKVTLDGSPVIVRLSQ